MFLLGRLGRGRERRRGRLGRRGAALVVSHGLRGDGADGRVDVEHGLGDAHAVGLVDLLLPHGDGPGPEELLVLAGPGLVAHLHLQASAGRQPDLLAVQR